MIKLPALSKPTLKTLQKEWSWIKSIESDNSTTELVEIEFTTVLKDGETYIEGSEYETRLKTRSDVVLGFQHALWLKEHQDEIPELKALREQGEWYIDFPALVVVYVHGSRCVPFLTYGGRQFVVHWSRLDSDFGGDGRIGVSSKQVSSTLGSSDTRSPEPLERIAIALEKIADHIVDANKKFKRKK